MKFIRILVMLVIANPISQANRAPFRLEKSYHVKENVLIGFLRFGNKPAFVNLLLNCWPNRIVTNLAKQLAEQGYYARIVQNVTKTYDKVNPNNDVYVLDLDCLNSQLALMHANDSGSFNYPRRWFIYASDTPSKCLPNLLNLPLNSRLYYFQSQTNLLLSVYRPLSNITYIYDQIGQISAGALNGFTSLNLISDYHHRRNQNGYELHIPFVWMHKESLAHLDDFRDLLHDPTSKHNRFMILLLMDIMNTTYVPFGFPNWGTLPKVHPNKNSTEYTLKYQGGMLGFIQNDTQNPRVQLLGTVSFPTIDRILFLDFQHQVNSYAKFTFRAPSLSLVNNILTMSFTTGVWLGCLGLLFIFFAVMSLIVRWEQRNPPWNTQGENLLKHATFDVIQMQIGAVCQQGAEAQPWTLAGRMTTFFLFLCFLFVYTAYSACIVALLQSTSDSILTLDDLLQTKISLGIEDVPWSKIFFLNQKDPLRKAIYYQKIVPAGRPENLYSAEIGVEKMRTEFFAYHAEDSLINSIVARTFYEHEKCGLKQIGYLNKKLLPYIPVKKGSILKEITNVGYCRLREHGLDYRHHRRIYAGKPKCIQAGGNFRSVSLNDCYFAVLTYIGGVTLTIGLFVMEHVINKFRAK